jgi:hypothetical protein
LDTAQDVEFTVIVSVLVGEVHTRDALSFRATEGRRKRRDHRLLGDCLLSRECPSNVRDCLLSRECLRLGGHGDTWWWICEFDGVVESGESRCGHGRIRGRLVAWNRHGGSIGGRWAREAFSEHVLVVVDILRLARFNETHVARIEYLPCGALPAPIGLAVGHVADENTFDAVCKHFGVASFDEYKHAATNLP